MMGRRAVAAALAVAAVSGGKPGRADEYTGGFRMEGDPKIETVFGDAEQFKRYVDRFHVDYAEMQRTREDFSRNVQAVVASLAAADKAGERGKCPADAVALSYARAFRFGQIYHRVGKELEANFISIRDLDALGETSGLTPDYRWKVGRALKVYPVLLKDFREMKVAFQEQLATEVRYHGCDPQGLIAKGEELEKTGAPRTAAPAKPGGGKKDKGGTTTAGAPPAQATTATFFIDNSSCTTTLRVYIDGALMGEVGSSAKAAFQSLVGRHDVCLIPSSSQQQCGDPGTLRRTYIHDGWSVTLRCD
jgi:hypothetical protein